MYLSCVKEIGRNGGLTLSMLRSPRYLLEKVRYNRFYEISSFLPVCWNKFHFHSSLSGGKNPLEDYEKSLPLSGNIETEDTHPDFRPRLIQTVENTEDELEYIRSDIRDTIKSEAVVVFMKGVPDAPICGFSKRLVDILDVLGVEYTSFDCLAHPTVRHYVKELSDWHTIPQLWIKGEFVGGIDIILKMLDTREFLKVLDEKKIPHRRIDESGRIMDS